MSKPELLVDTCFCGSCGSKGKGTCRMGSDSWSDDSFDRHFGKILKEREPDLKGHPEIGPADKVGIKAQLDLMMLEALPDEMSVEEMMVISRAAYDAIMDKWQAWVKAGEL